MVIKDGPNRFNELMKWGARFDTDAEGELTLGKEGGHSEYRVIHHKDSTGNEIERTLLARVEQLRNISLLPHHFAIDLITEYHLSDKKSEKLSFYGAYVFDQILGAIITIKADSTTLASGGFGMVKLWYMQIVFSTFIVRIYLCGRPRPFLNGMIKERFY